MMGDEMSSHITDEETVLSTPEPVAPTGESKADAFVRLAKYRVNKALERIRLIGHLSNKASYEYTPEHIEKITKAMHDEVDATMARFNQSGKDKPLFDL